MSFSTQQFIVQKITTSADEKKTIKNYYYDESGGKSVQMVDDENFEYPKYSDSTKIVEHFIKLIKEDDYKSYFSLLDQGYVYRLKGFESISKENAILTYVECHVRQMLEAIYFYNTNAFLRLINALIEKNDDKYYNAFFETIEHNTILNVHDLFNCGAENKFEAYEVIRDMEHVSSELKKDILNLVTQLDANAKNYSTLFNNLRLKCEVLELLKKKVSWVSRSEDYGPKRKVVNLLTILFLAAIPNVINFIATCGSDFLFFNKKTPRDLISVIGMGRKMLPQQFVRAP